MILELISERNERGVLWDGYVDNLQVFQGRENKRRGLKATVFLVIFKKTKAGTQKAWEKVIEAMVKEEVRPDLVGICKPQ